MSATIMIGDAGQRLSGAGSFEQRHDQPLRIGIEGKNRAELGMTGVQQTEPIRGDPGEGFLVRFDHALGKLGQPHQTEQALAGKALAGGQGILGMVEIDGRFVIPNQHPFFLPLGKGVPGLTIPGLGQLFGAEIFA